MSYPYGGGQYQQGGQYPNQGQGQYPNQGQGQYPNQGQGQYPNQGQGQYPNQGQGQYPNQSQGQYPNQGQGQYPNQTQYSNQGQYNNEQSQAPYQQQPPQSAPPPAYDDTSSKKKPTSPRKSKQTINDPQGAQQQPPPNQAPTEQQQGPPIDHGRYAGTKKQGDKICGCGKKMCLIIGIIGGIIGLLILIGIIVGIVMAVKAGGDDDDGGLRCQCMGGANCDKSNAFAHQFFEKCTKDQMCYGKYKYNDNPNSGMGKVVDAGCRANPEKRKCLRNKDGNGKLRWDECWCTYKKCFEYNALGTENICAGPCDDGDANLTRRR